MRLIATFLMLVLGACGPKVDPFAEAKVLAAAGLKDPASAQFRNLEQIDDAVCGEINAKNSYGGYVGFEPFSVRGGKALVFEPVGDELVDTVARLKTTQVCDEARLRTLNK